MAQHIKTLEITGHLRLVRETWAKPHHIDINLDVMRDVLSSLSSLAELRLLHVAITRPPTLTRHKPPVPIRSFILKTAGPEYDDDDFEQGHCHWYGLPMFSVLSAVLSVTAPDTVILKGGYKRTSRDPPDDVPAPQLVNIRSLNLGKHWLNPEYLRILLAPDTLEHFAITNSLAQSDHDQGVEHTQLNLDRPTLKIPMSDHDSSSSTSSSPIAHVPVDVFSKILDAVGDDPRTHSACSLVARRWHDIAIPFLFSTIVFKRGKLRPLTLLWDFLATHPHVTRFVKKLIIDGNIWQGEVTHVVVNFEQISASVSKLPALEFLCLQGLAIMPPPPGEPLSPVPLRTLRVADSLFVKPLSRIGIICMLLAAYTPHTLILALRKFYLGGDRHLEEDHHIRLISPRSIRLNTMILEGIAVQLVLEWLEAILDPDVLRQFATTIFLHPENSRALLSLLLSAGRRLESLRITTADVDCGIVPCAELETLGEMISVCASLRSLHIKFHPWSYIEDWEDSVRPPTSSVLFERLLPSAPPTLQHIAFDLPATQTPLHALFDLACLDDAWFSKRCPVLKILHIRFYGKYAVPDVKDAAIAALPGLHSTGILNITLAPHEPSW
ncbi:hypothetical protein K466DRAFT_603774 [Polyporus arcularius HHB13444]|uniref:Uncharacterized protein n=1 Tax=Polyporus arcularius HHB13444 TaxID=1314778 RepID=A0A5C3NYA1_9APHY|nr:hypothetical protein K466DRAFT_603774 [Polyporus arcularius HHB13444]